jgi:hypothetical protein
VTAFRVSIDGRAYEGHYDSPANAVFGCMRKDEIDLRSEMDIPSRWWATAAGKLAYHSEVARMKELLTTPLDIRIEMVTDRKVARKVHKA